MLIYGCLLNGNYMLINGINLSKYWLIFFPGLYSWFIYQFQVFQAEYLLDSGIRGFQSGAVTISRNIQGHIIHGEFPIDFLHAFIHVFIHYLSFAHHFPLKWVLLWNNLFINSKHCALSFATDFLIIKNFAIQKIYIMMQSLYYYKSCGRDQTMKKIYSMLGNLLSYFWPQKIDRFS